MYPPNSVSNLRQPLLLHTPDVACAKQRMLRRLILKTRKKRRSDWGYIPVVELPVDEEMRLELLVVLLVTVGFELLLELLVTVVGLELLLELELLVTVVGLELLLELLETVGFVDEEEEEEA